LSTEATPVPSHILLLEIYHPSPPCISMAAMMFSRDSSCGSPVLLNPIEIWVSKSSNSSSRVSSSKPLLRKIYAENVLQRSKEVDPLLNPNPLGLPLDDKGLCKSTPDIVLPNLGYKP